MEELEKTQVAETPENEKEVTETYKEMSPIKLILRRFFRSRLSIVGIVMLVFLFMFSFLWKGIYMLPLNKNATNILRSEISQNPPQLPLHL